MSKRRMTRTSARAGFVETGDPRVANADGPLMDPGAWISELPLDCMLVIAELLPYHLLCRLRLLSSYCRANAFHWIRSLDIEPPGQWNLAFLYYLGWAYDVIGSMTRLESLRIGPKAEVIDGTLALLLSKCPRLRSLSLPLEEVTPKVISVLSPNTCITRLELYLGQELSRNSHSRPTIPPLSKFVPKQIEHLSITLHSSTSWRTEPLEGFTADGWPSLRSLEICHTYPRFDNYNECVWRSASQLRQFALTSVHLPGLDPFHSDARFTLQQGKQAYDWVEKNVISTKGTVFTVGRVTNNWALLAAIDAVPTLIRHYGLKVTPQALKELVRSKCEEYSSKYGVVTLGLIVRTGLTLAPSRVPLAKEHFDFALHDMGLMSELVRDPPIVPTLLHLMSAYYVAKVQVVSQIGEWLVKPLIQTLATKILAEESKITSEIEAKAEAWTRILSTPWPLVDHHRISHLSTSIGNIALDLGFPLDPNIKTDGTPLFFVHPSRFEALEAMGREVGRPLDLAAVDSKNRDIFAYNEAHASSVMPMMVIAARDYAKFEAHWALILYHLFYSEAQHAHKPYAATLIAHTARFKRGHEEEFLRFASGLIRGSNARYCDLACRLHCIRNLYDADPSKPTAYHRMLADMLLANEKPTEQVRLLPALSQSLLPNLRFQWTNLLPILGSEDVTDDLLHVFAKGENIVYCLPEFFDPKSKLNKRWSEPSKSAEELLKKVEAVTRKPVVAHWKATYPVPPLAFLRLFNLSRKQWNATEPRQ